MPTLVRISWYESSASWTMLIASSIEMPSEGLQQRPGVVGVDLRMLHALTLSLNSTSGS